MGKDKLIRWAENQTFPNVFETDLHAIVKGATYMQGEWHEKAFENDKPIVLELGCGKGEYTVGLARIFPEKNFLGIDIKSHRFWRGAKTAIEEGLRNAAFLRTRIEFLDHHSACPCGTLPIFQQDFFLFLNLSIIFLYRLKIACIPG